MVGFPTPFSHQAGQKASHPEGHLRDCALPQDSGCAATLGVRSVNFDQSLSLLGPTHSLPPKPLIGS